MIDGNEDKMIEVLQNLKETREEIKRVEKDSLPIYQLTPNSGVTRAEYLGVLNSRMARLQSEAHILGIIGPAAKQSASGLAMATMHSMNPRHPQ